MHSKIFESKFSSPLRSSKFQFKPIFIFNHSQSFLIIKRGIFGISKLLFYQSRSNHHCLRSIVQINFRAIINPSASIDKMMFGNRVSNSHCLQCSFFTEQSNQKIKSHWLFNEGNSFLVQLVKYINFYLCVSAFDVEWFQLFFRSDIFSYLLNLIIFPICIIQAFQLFNTLSFPSNLFLFYRLYILHFSIRTQFVFCSIGGNHNAFHNNNVKYTPESITIFFSKKN